jgi:hypothetical protein
MNRASANHQELETEMDGTRFDVIARNLGRIGNRRQILGGWTRFTLAISALIAGHGAVESTDAAKRRRCRALNGTKIVHGVTFFGPNRCSFLDAEIAFHQAVAVDHCVGAKNPGCRGRCGAGAACIKTTKVAAEGGNRTCSVGNPGDNPSCQDTQGVSCFTNNGSFVCKCECIDETQIL